MATIRLSPHQIAEIPGLELEVHRSGNKIILFAAMEIQAFDDMLAVIAANEDIEDDGYTEAIMTTDGWSA